MPKLAEGFKWIPGFEDYYSINIDGKIHSYRKLCGPKRGWQLQDEPVSFVKWQRGVSKKARNTLYVQLHKDGNRVKVAINPTIKRLFGVKRFLYKRIKKPKLIVIEPR